MPELPEVETVCRGLAPVLLGQKIARIEAFRPDLRRALPIDLAAKVTGRIVSEIRRRGKYILLLLDDGGALILHLGMSGRIIAVATRRNHYDKHDHVVIEIEGNGALIFNDPRRFGTIDWCRVDQLEQHPLLVGLGIEPLGPDFTASYLLERLKRRKTNLKAVLLDQSLVAGLGNIYVSEALYFAALSPLRVAATISAKNSAKLVGAIQTVLRRAIEAGGSSFSNHVRPSGELGYFQHHWAVYGRAGKECPRCDCQTKIQRIAQAGRSTFYCPKYQR